MSWLQRLATASLAATSGCRTDRPLSGQRMLAAGRCPGVDGWSQSRPQRWSSILTAIMGARQTCCGGCSSGRPLSRLRQVALSWQRTDGHCPDGVAIKLVVIPRTCSQWLSRHQETAVNRACSRRPLFQPATVPGDRHPGDGGRSLTRLLASDYIPLSNWWPSSQPDIAQVAKDPLLSLSQRRLAVFLATVGGCPPGQSQLAVSLEMASGCRTDHRRRSDVTVSSRQRQAVVVLATMMGACWLCSGHHPTAGCEQPPPR